MTAEPPERLPRWFLLLPLLVVAVWWPLDPYWASDDWFALHYAADFGNVLKDFTGPQYSASDLFFFYRPLITASHWLDVAIGGNHPFWAHLCNVLVHAANALLGACLWRRLVADGRAFAAGALFALCPGLIGGLGWAAGRTDGLAALAGLGTVLLTVRWLEGRQRTRAPALLTLAAGLLCKETVLCVPGLVALAAFALAAPGPAVRLRQAVRTTWPFAVVLVGYFGLRLLALGRLGGGYDGAAYPPLSMLAGFGSYAFDLVDPLRWTAAADVLPATIAGSPLRPWFGAIPALAALAWLLQSAPRRRATVLAFAWFALASVPLASFFVAADNHHNLRYFALGFAGLAGLLAAGGWLPTLLTVAVFAPALAQMRLEQWRADTESRQLHRQLLQQVDAALPTPWFVAGLPHTSPSGMALQYHFGVDRVLEPPFGNGGVRVFAHRPFFAAPGAVNLLDADGLPLALPSGTTMLLRGGELLTTLPPRPILALPLACPPIVDCTTPRLEQIAQKTVVERIVTPGLRAEAMRLVFFTATGYLGAVVDQHAPVGAADGHVDLLRFFTDARCADRRELIRELQLPVVVDLLPEFPVLIEAGRARNGVFEPTHRARALVTFRFDRGLPALLRR